MGLYLLKFPARSVLLPLSRRLAAVHPDVLSYLATALTVGAAACYVFAVDAPALLLAAVALTLLRMGLNTVDGLLAIGRGRTSLIGEIVNALPDRYSDVLLVGGMALSSLCRPAIGLAGLAAMLLASYAGMLGKAVGVDWQHHGPMGKVERLICVMVFSLLQYALLAGGRTAWSIGGASVTPLECCLLLFVVLGQVAVFNRTRGAVRQITRLEWPASRGGRLAGRRVLVAYDSATGNTAAVARQIADSLQADLKRVDDVDRVDDYELVIVGSPTISSGPTEKVRRFLAAHRPVLYAGFVTYGAPVIGPRMARKALAQFRDAAEIEPLATCAIRGKHVRLPKLTAGRPNDDDLLSAYLFGVKLAKRLWR